MKDNFFAALARDCLRLAGASLWQAFRRDPYLLSFRRGRWRWPHLVAGVMLCGIVAVAFLLLVFFVSDLAFSRFGAAILPSAEIDLRPMPWDLRTLMLFVILAGAALAALPALALYHGRSSGDFCWGWSENRLSNFRRAAGAFLTVGALQLLLGWMTSPESFRFPAQSWSFAPWLLVGAAVIFAQTFGEEAIFRGYLLRTLGAVLPYRLLVTVIIATLFAWLHKDNLDIRIDPVPLLFAFWLDELWRFWLTFRTGGIAASWGSHFANNVAWAFVVAGTPYPLSNATLIYIVDPVWSGGGSYAWDVSFYIWSVVGVAMLFALTAVRRSPFYIAPAEV